jgi:hypothetical protein
MGKEIFKILTKDEAYNVAEKWLFLKGFKRQKRSQFHQTILKPFIKRLYKLGYKIVISEELK